MTDVGTQRITSAAEGWRAAEAVGRIAEMAAGLSTSEESARTMLCAMGEGVGDLAAMPDLIAAMRTRVERRPPSVFFEFARDAAGAFGDADAAASMQAPLAALIEGIKIIDDIQDGEPECLAAEVGAFAALNVAMAAFSWALELTAALPLPEASWRAAAAAIGRGLRETAVGQSLEATAGPGFESFWNVVDRKTPPLVATALELGALAAGAPPARAAALTKLAIPFGRILQINDDCNDALGTAASDWRAPHLNLLMLYGLSAPDGRELAALLRNAGEPASLRAAQVWLLRHGALAYAVHAQLTTLHALAETLEMLALPNPAPFLEAVERHRADAELLMRKSGVDREVAAMVASAPLTRPLATLSPSR
jgi:geranylgeranyl pyrophosphate synthase